MSILQKSMEEASVNFARCYDIAKEMKNQRLVLDCQLCLAFISFDLKEWAQAKEFFDQAYFVLKFPLMSCRKRSSWARPTWQSSAFATLA